MEKTALSEISQTGDQMLSVLEAVARNGPLSAAEVARICDINRTVAHRLLVTLSLRAYVRKGEGGYVVGPAIEQLRQNGEAALVAAAKPIMERLAAQTGETVVLHCLDGTDAMVVDQAVGKRHIVRVEHTPGSRHPLFKGASGWSILAFQDERMTKRVLRGMEDPKQAMKRIGQVRSDGFALSHDELQIGVAGVAVPLTSKSGKCNASIGILVPRLRAATLEGLAPILLKSVQSLNHFLD